MGQREVLYTSGKISVIRYISHDAFSCRKRNELDCWAVGDKLTFAPSDLFINTVNADSAAHSITLSNQNRT